jgi:hypothetical protein
VALYFTGNAERPRQNGVFPQIIGATFVLFQLFKPLPNDFLSARRLTLIFRKFPCLAKCTLPPNDFGTRELNRKTLLLGIIPQARPVLVDALSGHFDLIFCYTLDEAVAALDKSVDIAACGIYFSDGQAFDLLRLMKNRPDTVHIPFFTATASPGILAPGVEQGIEIATRALDGQGFLPLTRWRSELGDAAAFEKLRAALNQALNQA